MHTNTLQFERQRAEPGAHTNGTKLLLQSMRLKGREEPALQPPIAVDGIDPSVHFTHSRLGSKSWVRVDTFSAKVACRLDVNSHEEITPP